MTRSATRTILLKPGQAADYATAGIPEYWIAYPDEATITVLKLAGNTYIVHGVLQRGEIATSALLPDFAVPVNAVCDAV